MKCTSEGKPIFGKRTFEETEPSSPASYSSTPNRPYGQLLSPQKVVDDDWKLRIVYGILALEDAGVKSYAKVHLGITEGRDFDSTNLAVRFSVPHFHSYSMYN